MGQRQVNEFDISGYVVEVEGPERISATFEKRTLVLEVWNDKFKHEVPIEFANKNMVFLASIKPRDYVTVQFKLRARKTDRDGQVRRFISLEGTQCHKE